MVDGKWTQYYDIVNHTKCGRSKSYDEGARTLYLSDEARHILNVIRLQAKSDDEYIFTQNGKIISQRAVDYRVRIYCDRMGIPEKSLHDLRRTAASRLRKAGMSYEAIQKILGHADVKTTMMYIFDYTDEAQKEEIIEKALNYKAN